MKRALTKQQKTIRRIIVLTAVAIAFLILAQFVYYGNIYLEKQTNHEQIKEMIDSNLTYEEENLDEQLDMILQWIDEKHLTYEDRGRLYERASLIYQQKGAEMTYYRYLGYALFYLEHSSDKDYTVNIYLDLANFYANNFSYDHAKAMMDKALSIEAFDDIENLQVKSYAYRMQAVLEAVDGNNELAEELLYKSLDVLAESHTNTFEESYVAMDEAWLAYIYLETGRFDDCINILTKYENSDLLTTQIYRQVMLRDFIIPYYETRCAYFTKMAHIAEQEASIEEFNAKSKQAEEELINFMNLCEENGFEKNELATLLMIIDRYPVNDEEILNKFYAKLEKLYSRILEINNEDYAGIIGSQIADSQASMSDVEARADRNTYKNIPAIIIVSILLVAVSTVIILIIYSQVDGLSGLLNRKKMDRKLGRIKKSGLGYTIVMMDIDNFKSINDTYGHDCGDAVIQRLGEILTRENKSNVKAFRYGGEEFTLLIIRDAQKSARIIAERVRMSMENESWDFDKDLRITLSIGIANGQGPEDVMKKADENLYLSKQSGKNKISM